MIWLGTGYSTLHRELLSNTDQLDSFFRNIWISEIIFLYHCEIRNLCILLCSTYLDLIIHWIIFLFNGKKSKYLESVSQEEKNNCVQELKKHALNTLAVEHCTIKLFSWKALNNSFQTRNVTFLSVSYKPTIRIVLFKKRSSTAKNLTHLNLNGKLYIKTMDLTQLHIKKKHCTVCQSSILEGCV